MIYIIVAIKNKKKLVYNRGNLVYKLVYIKRMLGNAGVGFQFYLVFKQIYF